MSYSNVTHLILKLNLIFRRLSVRFSDYTRLFFSFSLRLLSSRDSAGLSLVIGGIYTSDWPTPSRSLTWPSDTLGKHSPPRDSSPAHRECSLFLWVIFGLVQFLSNIKSISEMSLNLFMELQYDCWHSELKLLFFSSRAWKHMTVKRSFWGSLFTTRTAPHFKSSLCGVWNKTTTSTNTSGCRWITTGVMLSTPACTISGCMGKSPPAPATSPCRG